MAINKNSTGFTILFSVIMVVIVGSALSITAMSLKPLQEKNNRVKKMMDILGAVKVESTRKNADEIYDQYVTAAYTITHTGEPVEEGVDAFAVDVQKEYRNRAMPEEEKGYPLYEAEKDGKKYYIIPMVGTGLWGPLWGFVSLESDLNTIYGASFDHKSETPGLGAEIKEDAFEMQFEGKKILDEQGELQSILVRKGGAIEGNPHQVDGITGGTITSNGVTEMLERTFSVYNKYFEQLRAGENQTSAVE